MLGRFLSFAGGGGGGSWIRCILDLLSLWDHVFS